ncbi:hypothetical protein [Adonisia turfae]|uniref:Uncharacterized protein n=1 Tax=Adonisia turfae CCMR0081 TaxID=2292702 RepID=A0A6M0RDX6_9CYAN|nr:hypothetical protein [Adonisia turfae]NEZ54113.1 hypothetical protein [Adonisia turfae CCMR0081]
MTQVSQTTIQSDNNSTAPNQKIRWRDRINFQQIGAFIGGVAAIGSLVGVAFAVYTFLDESPKLEISISELDLIGYIPQSDQRILETEIFRDLLALEETYSGIVDEYVIQLMRETYELLINAERAAVQYTDGTPGEQPDDRLETYQKNFSSTITELEKRRDNASEENKEKYSNLISGLTRIKSTADKIQLKDKIFLELSVENGSRLSNYLHSQGILIFRQEETVFAAVPQIIMNLVDEERRYTSEGIEIEKIPDAGKIGGHEVSSFTFEAELENLEKDNQEYVELAFQDRAGGDDKYTLMFAIEDVKEEMWHKEAEFSTFTARRTKQELKTKVEPIFNELLKGNESDT